MSMIEEEWDQLQMEHRAGKTKEVRRKYILRIILLIGTPLAISASAAKDRSTFILLFSTMIIAYAVALVQPYFMSHFRGVGDYETYRICSRGTGSR
jgi:hypothetical protein